ncbi:MAG TPA: cyclic nucleotide-binding domain-containing protein [Halanaerobiales bacterium]|nr:cyclic nucleotide-binding domain-containing protein [Halanaerobiales bacterium]
MKKVMVVPTYWGRDSQIGWQLGDDIYDHPTPLDKKGTLPRFFESLQVIENQDFELVIILATTTNEIEKEACEKVQNLIKKYRPKEITTYLLSARTLDKIKTYYNKNSSLPLRLFSLSGYSNIRNICIFGGYLAGGDVVILIDDDEIFQDESFIKKASEFIGGRFYGQTVDGIAGYYINENGEYYDDVNIEPWMTYWNRFGSKSKAFDKIIGNSPRLKITPFAFGGLMVIHKNLYKIVPFDPNLTRGEDIDYLINARMFGFNFFLDNKLSILHLPPEKPHPVWQRFRQDMYRFYYEKKKLDTQFEKSNMQIVNAKDFDPYPGEFMKEDLEDKIFKANIMLALDYLSDNEIENTKAALKNIHISKYSAEPEYNVFEHYLKLQDEWEKILTFADENLPELQNIFKKTAVGEQKKKVEVKKEIKSYPNITDLPIFKTVSEKELDELLSISQFNSYEVGDKILTRGDKDDALYIIQEGKVKILNNKKEEGKEIKLAELERGDFFGLTSLIASKSANYLVDVVAQTPVKLVKINRDDIFDFFSANHESSVKLLLYFMKKLNKQLEDLTEMYTDVQLKDRDISQIMDE